MITSRSARAKQLTPASIGFAALLALLSCAGAAEAGILLPEQIDFTADDLERSLSGNESAGAGSSSRSRHSQPLSPNDDNNQREPFGLEQANLPSGGTSSGGSSSSSSSSGSSLSCGAIGWALNNTIAIRDDSPLGRLAEDHGLALPDPPGTDLLRPPRGRV